MAESNYPRIAQEGWPFLGAAAVGLLLALRSQSIALIGFSAALLVVLVLLFRDPWRKVPSVPLAVVAPVDGRVLSVAPTDKGCLEGECWRIVIRVNHLGAYTARSPTEGQVLNLRENVAAGSRLTGAGGLWVQTDEGDNVVLLMRGPRWIGNPQSFVRFGERLGQGQRCAYIRLASRAELYVPINSRMMVKEGDRVSAGTDTLAMLVRK